MDRWKRVRGLRGAARGLVVVAAMLLPLAAVLQTPRTGEAESAAQDTLWAVTGTGVSVCESPASPASLSGCFAVNSSSYPKDDFSVTTTDGVNVYVVDGSTGYGLSCPIADLGTNCTAIMAGLWPSGGSNAVTALAAAGGYLWIGQQDGLIYKCPNNLPWQQQSDAPSQCVTLDDAGQRGVTSLLLANGRLYAGLNNYGTEQSKQGILWSCDPNTVNACANLDSYGKTYANVLVAGGGYLWAGLENGIVWRCDPDTVNSCDNWEQSGYWIPSLSYNGQGTLYAAVGGYGDNGVIWSCPIATANSCSNLVKNVNGISVAAGPDGVFSSAESNSTVRAPRPQTTTVRFGTSTYSAYALGSRPQLLYIPAEGQTGVGGAKVEVGAVSLPAKLDRRCRDGSGKGPRVQVTVRGPHGMTRSQQVGLCALRGGATTVKTFSLLDPGTYVVTARSKKGAYVAHGKLTVEQDATKTIEVLLAPRHG